MNAKEVFEEWQNANNLPDYLKDQLDTLGKDEKWIEDAFGQDINFGTAGMRGRLEPGTNRINLFTVGRVTEGLARLIDENGEEAKKRGVSLKGIRYAVSGAMHLPTDLVAEWEEATGGMLVEGYGLSECSPLVSCNPLNSTRRAGSIGVPFPSTDIRVVDPETLKDVPDGAEGELLVRGPQVMRGYWKRGEDTSKTLLPGGWLRTGDIVRLDHDYFIEIVDRIKEVIITGGFNVSPTEVENVLKQHDSVADCAVVGLPDGSGGEKVTAAIIPAEGHAIDPEELKQHCYERLTRYKVPKNYYEVDELPRSMLGKTLRRKVRESLEAKYS